VGEALRRGESAIALSNARLPMKIKSAVFTLSAPDLESCPKSALPEFAFIGRSNVGKSSLINTLAERRSLAKVSDLPGKTKLINFFLMNGAWHLVDLPGYGYAAGGQREQRGFQETVSDYLAQRRNLFCTFVLIDSRLTPQQIDLEFVNWLAAVPAYFVLVFTKTDKQSAQKTQANIALFKARLAEYWKETPQIFTCSSETKAGRTELLDFIEKILTENNNAV
jgi:GTP-binding protein